MLNVDRDVVMPEVGGGLGDRRRKYPWLQLNPVTGNPPRGDSFLVECDYGNSEQVWNSLTSCAHSISHRTGRKFIMRRVLDGIRVWRLK